MFLPFDCFIQPLPLIVLRFLLSIYLIVLFNSTPMKQSNAIIFIAYIIFEIVIVQAIHFSFYIISSNKW